MHRPVVVQIAAAASVRCPCTIKCLFVFVIYFVIIVCGLNVQLQEAQRQAQRQAAEEMRADFVRRQAEALANKAAAEADLGHAAIYVPARPRPAPRPERAAGHGFVVQRGHAAEHKAGFRHEAQSGSPGDEAERREGRHEVQGGQGQRSDQGDVTPEQRCACSVFQNMKHNTVLR